MAFGARADVMIFDAVGDEAIETELVYIKRGFYIRFDRYERLIVQLWTR